MREREWIVSYGGGVGENVWDMEMYVFAPNILSAIVVAEQRLMEVDPFDGRVVRGAGEIFAIEQKE